MIEDDRENFYDLVSRSKVTGISGPNTDIRPAERDCLRTFFEKGRENGVFDDDEREYMGVPRGRDFREILCEKLEEDPDYSREDLQRHLEEGFVPGEVAVGVLEDEVENLPEWAFYDFDSSLSMEKDGLVEYNIDFSAVVSEPLVRQSLDEGNYDQFTYGCVRPMIFRGIDFIDAETATEMATEVGVGMVSNHSLSISGKVDKANYD